jgi:hypothetical protein
MVVAAVGLTCGALPAHASMVVPDLFGTSMNGDLFLHMLASTLLVEYLLTRSALHPWVKWYRVLPVFIYVNLVTFLPTMMLANLCWGAQIVPLIAEPFMWKRWSVIAGTVVPDIRGRIICANFCSFVMGVVAYHYMWKNVLLA